MTTPSMHRKHCAVRAALATLTLATSAIAFAGCETHENGTTRSTSTRVEDTPNERTKTTTTHERTVEPVR